MNSNGRSGLRSGNVSPHRVQFVSATLPYFRVRAQEPAQAFHRGLRLVQPVAFALDDGSRRLAGEVRVAELLLDGLDLGEFLLQLGLQSLAFSGIPLGEAEPDRGRPHYHHRLWHSLGK